MFLLKKKNNLRRLILTFQSHCNIVNMLCYKNHLYIGGNEEKRNALKQKQKWYLSIRTMFRTMH